MMRMSKFDRTARPGRTLSLVPGVIVGVVLDGGHGPVGVVAFAKGFTLAAVVDVGVLVVALDALDSGRLVVLELASLAAQDQPAILFEQLLALHGLAVGRRQLG